jgi:hypothetical protein
VDQLLTQARAAAERGEVDAAISLCDEAHRRWPDQLEQTLDGVASVDGAVANLAGKLGGPAWVLPIWAAEWRWGPRGATTPWFPTVTVLRQLVPGDWASVMRMLAQVLASRPR